ncbi:hypothetical protein ZWY2020_008202 [Hordeum vulgare]|nr:hypothetical protein ZWY2020_008202 [Hordeum vulgare]
MAQRVPASGALVASDKTDGNAREDTVVSGLPTSTSSERLEILDDGSHILSFSIVDGEHCLRNYRSVSSVTEIQPGPYCAIVESYVVHDG